jgi:hypothetical protein
MMKYKKGKKQDSDAHMVDSLGQTPTKRPIT